MEKNRSRVRARRNSDSTKKKNKKLICAKVTPRAKLTPCISVPSCKSLFVHI